jgi:hypothetical protein
MSMPVATDWTAERVRALPDDGKRYEVGRGAPREPRSASWSTSSDGFREVFSPASAWNAHGG